MSFAHQPSAKGKQSVRTFLPRSGPAVLVMALVLLAGCGSSLSSGTVSPGWRDISPPSPMSSTGRVVGAYYALSAGAPGLIVACLVPYHVASIGGPEFGPAAIWRTRDGGKSWQQLPPPPFTASCELAMPQGDGELVYNYDYMNTGAIFVSQDAGSHWDKMQVSDPAPYFDWLAQGLYRDGKLYHVNTPPGSGDAQGSWPTMSYSSDGGQSWVIVPTSPDTNIPLTPSVPHEPVVQFADSITPDYRASGDWYRLIGISQDTSHDETFLEHSADGGRSWQFIQTLQLDGQGTFMGMLATNPSAPARVCASTAPNGGGLFGPTASRFAASDDGGRTWNTGVVASHAPGDGLPAGVVFPGVVMDMQGNCYLGDQWSPSSSQLNVPAAVTFWRFAVGATAPQKLAQLANDAAVIGIEPGAGDASSRLAVALESNGSVAGSLQQWG